MTLPLAIELGRAIDEARAAGGTFVDCVTLERLLHRHSEHTRRDLLAGDQLSRVPAP